MAPMDLTLPLDNAAIEKILLHRYPFLFVDRITEFEVDKRIVGIKNVSLNERYLSNDVNGSPVLPPLAIASRSNNPLAAFVMAAAQACSCFPTTGSSMSSPWPSRRPILPSFTSGRARPARAPAAHRLCPESR